ncbi:hypothetical protein M1O50_06305, partial [Dehalococcoidia bacterium]|nr:hypothetical protein [Dehalococcoidia bacterium]
MEKGDEGLIHRSRGQPSNRGKAAEVRETVLSVYQERYWGFGPTPAAEKLVERDGYQGEHETLRRWLMSAGVRKRHRKRSKHRNRRERKAHFGELVQMDGNHHQWFSGHKGKSCLMDMVDDATGITLTLMRREEATKAAMEGLDLRNVFCIEETGVISNGWVARYKNRFLQIVRQSKLPPAKKKVIVQEH